MDRCCGDTSIMLLIEEEALGTPPGAQETTA